MLSEAQKELLARLKVMGKKQRQEPKGSRSAKLAAKVRAGTSTVLFVDKMNINIESSAKK